MVVKRRRLNRRSGFRNYRQLFVVSVEGAKTEKQYFHILKKLSTNCTIECLSHKSKSSPRSVLSRMKNFLQSNTLRKHDEAWLVVDKNNWSDQQLLELHHWKQKRNCYGLAVSNPKFEYWLLLHFEDGTGILSSQECTMRLNQYISNYDKGIPARKLTLNSVRNAIRRAEQRDNPPCSDWPRHMGNTTVYRLVEKIFPE